MSNPFSISQHTTADKKFVIDGPEGFTLIVDYDDVDHEFQDMMAERIVEVLNKHFE